MFQNVSCRRANGLSLKPLHAPQANNHSIMIKLFSKTNDIFQTPEMNQTIVGNAVV